MARSTLRAALPLLFALAGGLAVALVLTPALFQPKNMTVKMPSISTPMITESIGNLTAADSSSKRISAARYLSEQFQSNPDAVVQSLGQSLTNDPDPAVRAQTANSLGQIARQARESRKANQEQLAQIAQMLQTQYEKEASDTVRRCIIGAAAELDSPAVDQLIEKAIADNDPSVKEEALRARIERDRRAQLKRLG